MRVCLAFSKIGFAPCDSFPNYSTTLCTFLFKDKFCLPSPLCSAAHSGKSGDAEGLACDTINQSECAKSRAQCLFWKERKKEKKKAFIELMVD